jgi:Cu/Ag efflux protein CusF
MGISTDDVEADVYVRLVEHSSPNFNETPEAILRYLTFSIAVGLILSALIACKSSPQTGGAPAQVTSAKRYHLTGTVVSVDKRAHMLNVDGQEIPGLMPAMTMPYNVKPESELDKLSPGDSITADVVAQGDNSWLENIAVTHPSPGAARK